MNIQTIAEHSVDIDLLSGGICIDAGCRGFKFSEAMRDLGCYVLAMDLEYMEPENPENIHFMQRALMIEPGQYYYVDTKDQQAKFISNTGIQVDGVGIHYLYNELKEQGKEIDVLKLDVEGTEYFLLADPNFQPAPKQISVEFHMHCHRQIHDIYYPDCMRNLLQYYEPAQHELTQAHGAGFNYWNSLFIRKDLL
jgi:Methyltransferase FkbM domain